MNDQSIIKMLNDYQQTRKQHGYPLPLSEKMIQMLEKSGLVGKVEILGIDNCSHCGQFLGDSIEIPVTYSAYIRKGGHTVTQELQEKALAHELGHAFALHNGGDCTDEQFADSFAYELLS